MKYFVIILALSITGCASQREGFDYLGKQPWYAVKAPHAPTCPCCFGKKVLTPAPLPAILKVQQSKKDNMSLSKNARCSQVVKNMNGGKYVKNNSFHNFGSVVTDCLLAQQEEADRRLAQIKLKRKRA